MVQAQREAVIARLSSAFAHDVLSIDEFERRVGEVYRAETRGDLVRLTADLPLEPAVRAGLPLALDRDDAPPPLPVRLRSTFSSMERGGPVSIPPRVDIIARFASIELDLRSAWFLPGVTEIAIRGVMSNIEIQLPPDVSIENDGDWVICTVTVQRSDAVDDAFPTSVVRISGRAVLSNVEVLGKPREKRRR